MVSVMFIRFVSGEIHEDSQVSAGLFTAAFDLLDNTLLSFDEYWAIGDLIEWFNEHLKDPFEYRLKAARRPDRAVCWFKPTAHEHLARAWELATILEANDVFI